MEFNEDHFSSRIPVWKKYVAPALTDRPVTCVEVGTFEGRSACWLLEHAFTDSASKLFCIDLWWDEAIYERFVRNVEKWTGTEQVEWCRGEWRQEALKLVSRFSFRAEIFDFIYLDADHRAQAVLSQASFFWPFLRRGGLLVIDDYPLEPQSAGKLPLRVGVDAFLEMWAGEYEIIHKEWQVILLRR